MHKDGNDTEDTRVKLETDKEHIDVPPQQSEDQLKDGSVVSVEQPQQQKQNLITSQFSHPIYKKISATNGHINRMPKGELIEALQYLKLSTRGTKEVLQKRLKVYTKKQCLKESHLDNKEEKEEKQYTDFYIVIDFEATCEDPNPPGYLHEIIEFPAILIDAKTNSIVSEFHSYCRPEKNPELTEFCKKLTGISQLQVETASTFQTVLRRFDVWLKEQVNPQEKFVIATDGPWDINKFLKSQCKDLGIQVPYYFHRWANVRKHFTNYYKLHQVNLELMLEHLELTFIGRPHSGIDDSRNIARILIELIKDGANVLINETFR